MRLLARVALAGCSLTLLVMAILYWPLLDAYWAERNQRIGSIDFFGAALDADLETLRAKLPIKPGDSVIWLRLPGTQLRIEAAAGRSPVEISTICCDERRDSMVFIGLGGRSAASHRPRPTNATRLSQPLRDLYQQFMVALMESVRTGAREEHSEGYAVSKDPKLRAVQLQLREAALANEPEILKVLAESADDGSRAAAAQLLGYARRSKSQLTALAQATHDSDGAVRNNATRALGVLLDAFPDVAADIDLEPFIEQMHSATWSDRNKASMVLEMATRARNPQLAASIRAKALGPLIEMARWKAPHSGIALTILGQMAGLPTETLRKTIAENRREEIINAAAGGASQ